MIEVIALSERAVTETSPVDCSPVPPAITSSGAVVAADAVGAGPSSSPAATDAQASSMERRLISSPPVGKMIDQGVSPGD